MEKGNSETVQENEEVLEETNLEDNTEAPQLPKVTSAYSVIIYTVDSGYSELPRDRQKWFTITEVPCNRSNLHRRGLEGTANVVHYNRKFTISGFTITGVNCTLHFP